MKFITIILTLIIIFGNVKSQDSLNIVESDSLKFDNPKITISDSWFGLDKGQHFTGSLIGTILLSQVNNRHFNINKSNSKAISVGIIFSFGITKELFDSRKEKNIFSWKDLVANIAGIVSGIAILGIR